MHSWCDSNHLCKVTGSSSNVSSGSLPCHMDNQNYRLRCNYLSLMYYLLRTFSITDITVRGGKSIHWICVHQQIKLRMMLIAFWKLIIYNLGSKSWKNDWQHYSFPILDNLIPPRRHLEESQDIFGFHCQGLERGVIGIWQVEARNAAKHSTMPRTDPITKKYSAQIAHNTEFAKRKLRNRGETVACPSGHMAIKAISCMREGEVKDVGRSL